MTSSPSFSALSSALLSYALEEFNSAAPFFDAALAELTVEEKGEEAVVDSGAGGRAKAGRASAEEVARVRLARAANSLQRSDFAGALADCDAALAVLGDAAGVGAVAHSRRGRALFALSRFDEALTAFQAAVEREGKTESSQSPSAVSQTTASALWVRKCRAEMARASQHSQRTTTAAAAGTATSSTPSTSSSSSSSSSAAPSSSSSSSAALASKVTLSWFQSRSHVTLTLFAKNLAKDAAHASLDPANPRTLHANLRMPDGSAYERSWQLFDDVEPSSLQLNLSPYRLELQLKKVREGEWQAMEATAEQQKAAAVVPRANVVPDPVAGAAASSSSTAYPTSSKRRVEWNEVEQQAAKMEEEDKPTGDAALQKLFQTIYKDASEDTRRAMIKSFQTSGGTVLSTNWDEVKKTDYERSIEAPKGSEVKSWINP